MLRLRYFLAREMTGVRPNDASMCVRKVRRMIPKFAQLAGSQVSLNVAERVDQKHGPLWSISKLNAVVKSHNQII
jgi:hypothetical protein